MILYRDSDQTIDAPVYDLKGQPVDVSNIQDAEFNIFQVDTGPAIVSLTMAAGEITASGNQLTIDVPRSKMTMSAGTYYANVRITDSAGRKLPPIWRGTIIIEEVRT